MRVFEKAQSFVFSSPSAASFEDTHNTLKYANRAKNIKANVSEMTN